MLGDTTWRKKFILFLLLLTTLSCTLNGCILYDIRKHGSKVPIQEKGIDEDNSNQYKLDDTNIQDITIKREEESDEEVRSITISVVGDIMVHSPQFKSAMIEDGGYDFFPVFEEIREHIVNSDLALCNLETTISTPEKGYTGYPCFKTPEALIPAMKNTGFDVVITANNHSLDALEFGVINTLDALDRYELFHTGTFRSKEESDSLLTLNRGGIKLAILAYTYGTNGMEAAMDKDKLDYMVNYIDKETIAGDIQRAKKEDVDIIILYMHWGIEYSRIVDDYIKKLADDLFNAGADIILGSHPHVIQPMERKTIIDDDSEERQVFIAYSLGNFISNQREQYRDSGIIVNIAIVKKGNKTTIHDVTYTPTWVRKYEDNGKLQYKILPVEKFIDSGLPAPELNRIKSVWQETTGIIDDERIKTTK